MALYNYNPMNNNFNPSGGYEAGGGMSSALGNYLTQPNALPQTNSFGSDPTGVTPNTGMPTAQPNTGMNFSALATGLNVAAGGLQAYTGYRQLRLAEKNFRFNRGLAETNLSNQAQTYNTNLEERQKRRLDARGEDYSGLSSYLQKNRVSGKIGG